MVTRGLFFTPPPICTLRHIYVCMCVYIYIYIWGSPDPQACGPVCQASLKEELSYTSLWALWCGTRHCILLSLSGHMCIPISRPKLPTSHWVQCGHTPSGNISSSTLCTPHQVIFHPLVLHTPLEYVSYSCSCTPHHVIFHLLVHTPSADISPSVHAHHIW